MNRETYDWLERQKVAPRKMLKSNWSEPRCYAPRVDVTRASQAYGKWALPKLAEELCGQNVNIVRQAVTSIADIAVNPEEMVRIVEQKIPQRIADLLISEDPYLRETVAMIFGTMSRQAAGREAIFKYPKILELISRGLGDNLSAVRTKMAQAIENLARDAIAAEVLWKRGFLEKLIEVIDSERNATILALHLETLGSLLNNGTTVVNIRAIEMNAMEKLVGLLDINSETIVVSILDCLARLCQEKLGKQKSVQMHLSSIVKPFLNDQRRSVHKKAAAVIVFTTISTPGKLQAFELGIVDRLVRLAGESNDRALQLVSIQALTNIAEVPDVRKTLRSEHCNFLADVCVDGTTEKFKNILMNKICSS